MVPKLDLQPSHDCGWEDGRWHSTARCPWLNCPGLVRWRGRWIELTYESGLFDPMVRPLIRFTDAAGDHVTVPMNGAPAGVGRWIGPVPRGTTQVALSPVAAIGPFSFRLTRVRAVSRAGLVVRGVLRQPRLALMALGARLIRARAEARHCLKFASLGTPLDDYPAWQAARRRAIDRTGFDRPHADWTTGPTIHVLTEGAAHAAAHSALAAQSYPHWRLHVIDGGLAATPVAAVVGAADLVLSLHPGDILLPEALGLMADRLTTSPALSACYGDDELAGIPRLKPDFSPVFAASSAYLDRGILVRAEALARSGVRTLEQALDADTWLSALRADEVASIRRPVICRASPRALPSRPSLAIGKDLPSAAIIVPTRDRPDLLAACLATIRATAYPDIEVVLVDNGTVDAAAVALLNDAALLPRCTVIRMPGPFNYAAMCNAGADASTAPILAFLNNDVSAIAGDWLARLATRASHPGIGAVGPKLLFPDGRVQHGGVVVGLGETAQNAYRQAPDGAGYMNQLSNAREIGAVTGAVQVIERRKFDAVGGFDSAHFPVLLNDIDLCLRLAAQGWASLYEPAAVMIHRESASRGYSPRAIALHAKERRHFSDRWLERIRDDPFFHPALSLYAWQPMLA